MVLTTARRPAILVELGYSTNPQDGQFLTTRSVRRPWPRPWPTPSWPTCSSTSARRARSGIRGCGNERWAPDSAGGGAPCGLAASLLGACVYYNGMYNANRLANSARKAEREGRTFEANNLWGQVATKAESVVVRHPKSKYAEEATILKGLALARLGQCEQALAPSAAVTVAAVGTDLTSRMPGWRLAGARYPWATSRPAMRPLPRWSRARIPGGGAKRAFLRGPDAAPRWDGIRRRCACLEGVHGAVAPSAERLLSLAGAGRVPEAMALADSLVARGDTTQPWDSLLVSLGQQDPSNASSLVDRVRRLPNRSTETQARWLLEDGLG